MEPMDAKEPMVPTEEPMTPPAEAPPRPKSRIKNVVAGLAIAGMLTGLGAVSVFAASAQPSSSGAPSASDNGAGGAGTNHVCPDKAGNGTNSSGGTNSSSSS
jgi:hypothetical protein